MLSVGYTANCFSISKPTDSSSHAHPLSATRSLSCFTAGKPATGPLAAPPPLTRFGGSWTPVTTRMATSPESRRPTLPEIDSPEKAAQVLVVL